MEPAAVLESLGEIILDVLTTLRETVESIMSASLASECNEVKERYDTCFLKWYSEKYLKGNSNTDECEPLFKQYRTCLTKALKDRGIDTMIDEAREMTNDTDKQHLRR